MRDQLAARASRRRPTSARAGLNPRADIAGLNRAQVPSVLVELRQLKNPADSALMKTGPLTGHPTSS